MLDGECSYRSEMRQTVAELGGELAIDGKGTTMTLRLPYLKGRICSRDPCTWPSIACRRITGPSPNGA